VPGGVPGEDAVQRLGAFDEHGSDLLAVMLVLRDRAGGRSAEGQGALKRRPARRSPGLLAAGQALLPSLADADEAEGAQHGPPSGSPDRRIVRVRVRAEESCCRAGGQQQPGGREIRRRVAGAQFTEVGHAGQRPFGDDDIRGMEITVNP
jgi:hypothetical protein